MYETENKSCSEVVGEEQARGDVEISTPVFIASTSDVWCNCCKEGANE